jgi:hypothetical protein
MKSLLSVFSKTNPASIQKQNLKKKKRNGALSFGNIHNAGNPLKIERRAHQAQRRKQTHPTQSDPKPIFRRKNSILTGPSELPLRAGDGDGGDGRLEAPAGGVRRRGRCGGEGEERRRGGAAAVLPAAHPRPPAPDPTEDPQPQPP